MSKKSFIDSVEVKSPCTEDWNKMHGNDRVRFCDHCAKDVRNLSAVTRKEAMRLVQASGGGICIRYVKNPVTNQPVFADQLFQIARRAPGIAAGIMTASLSLSTASYAQGGLAPSRLTGSTAVIDSPLNNAPPKADGADRTTATPKTWGTVSGVVFDPDNAVIPNTVITLIGDKASDTKTATSNGQGEYRFENVRPGRYILQAEAAGFASHAGSLVVLADNLDETVIGIGLDLKVIEVSVEILANVEIQSVTSGGIGFVEYSTALHRAVAADDIEQVKELIAQGEKVDGTDENYDKITPLFIAVENGNVEIARLLLEFGAKANARDGEKQTPLMRLDEDAAPELVELLLTHGAKINLTDKSGNTAFIMAAELVKPEVLEVLIRGGADVDVANKAGQTALMNAAYGDLLESVRLILEAGARVNLKNKSGETAWDLASDEKVREMLVSFGAEAKETDDETDSETTEET